MFFAETPKKETATRASCTQEEAKRCFRGGLKLENDFQLNFLILGLG